MAEEDSLNALRETIGASADYERLGKVFAASRSQAQFALGTGISLKDNEHKQFGVLGPGTVLATVMQGGALALADKAVDEKQVAGAGVMLLNYSNTAKGGISTDYNSNMANRKGAVSLERVDEAYADKAANFKADVLRHLAMPEADCDAKLKELQEKIGEIAKSVTLLEKRACYEPFLKQSALKQNAAAASILCAAGDLLVEYNRICKGQVEKRAESGKEIERPGDLQRMYITGVPISDAGLLSALSLQPSAYLPLDRGSTQELAERSDWKVLGPAAVARTILREGIVAVADKSVVGDEDVGYATQFLAAYANRAALKFAGIEHNDLAKAHTLEQYNKPKCTIPVANVDKGYEGKAANFGASVFGYLHMPAGERDAKLKSLQIKMGEISKQAHRLEGGDYAVFLEMSRLRQNPATESILCAAGDLLVEYGRLCRKQETLDRETHMKKIAGPRATA